MIDTLIATMGNQEGASFFSYIGIACALVFANMGAAYGTAKAGVGICSMGVLKPDLIIKSVIPVIMAGILGIYGLIVAVILIQKTPKEVSDTSSYSYITGFGHLSSGLCCGLSSLAAGFAIGIAGDAGVRALGQQDRIFVGLMLIMIFAEALGLYGMIISLIIAQ